MPGMILQFILLLIVHAAAGIYSSTLKYSAKTTYIIWGTWVVLQTALLIYTEFVLRNWALQFFGGFVLSLVGQYVIFLATTKGKLAQRFFTMLTYSVFFCIVISFFSVIEGTFVNMHWAFTSLVHAVLLLAIKDPDKRIVISVKESVQRLLIKVENPYRTSLAFDESVYGVGIHSVITVTNKYDGMYDFSAEDGIFSAKISLNLK